MSRKKTIAVYADSPTVPTGFGQVAKNIFVPLSKQYDIKFFGINYDGYPHEFPFPIWPANNPLMSVTRPGDPYGRQHLKQWLENQDFDLFFLLSDGWVLREFIPELLKPIHEAGKPVVVYFPIDCDEYDPQWYQWMEEVDMAVTYTQYGKEIVNRLCPKVNLRVIPHGADTMVYHPLRKDNERVKELRAKVDADFVWLNVNVNQPRKNIPASIEAMRYYMEMTGFPNEKMVLHMKEADPFGYHLPMIAKGMFPDVERRVILVSAQKLKDADMVVLYSTSDAVISTTHGEGWGLSITEGLSTETPVIAPAHTSIPEVSHGFAKLIDPGRKHCALPFQNDRSIFRYFVDPKEMAKAMIEVKENYDHWHKQAKRGRIWYQENLQWAKHVVPQWDQLFKEVLSNPVKVVENAQSDQSSQP
jgi:glycosyltransferase involved in cell wall biosynthesis